MSLAGLSEALRACALGVSAKAISKWETGETVPNAYQLMAVCRVLDIDDIFPDAPPRLNDVGLRKLEDYRLDLIASGRYAPHSPGRIEYIDMPVCRLSVSAGTGMFLDGDDYESVRFPRSSVPDGASFGLRVAGDSMEPVYQDGQIVWVQPCKALRPGEIGVMVCDGEGYLKVYDERTPDDVEAFTDSDGVLHGQPVMISCNPQYPPRIVSPDEAFRIVGRVL